MKVFNIGAGERFFSFTNADGKTWFVPVRNMRTALGLYQPSGWKGKILKRYLFILCWLRFLRRFLHVEMGRCELDKDFKGFLCSLFDTADIEFSVFLGTPSVHQKITIQLSCGEKILGYCKVTDRKEIAGLFEHEAGILERLNGCGVEGIPRCLFSGEWRDGIYLFVQSTKKTNRSLVPHQWGKMQDVFLNELHERTKRKIVFEESDFYRSLMSLREHSDWLPDAEAKETVGNAVEEVLEENGGKIVEYSAYHADFTPWNMFAENGKLFVFDWEYSKASYPPLLDRYHYFMQTAIFEQHKDAKEITQQLQTENWISNKHLRYYLLDVVSRYAMREKGKYNGDVAMSMKIWLELLRIIK